MNPVLRSASTTSVTDLFAKVFPQLSQYLREECEDHTLPPTVRPIIGHSAVKVCKLWAAPVMYVWVEEDSRLTIAKLNQRSRYIALRDCITKAQEGDDTDAAKSFLRELMEGEDRIPITLDDDAASGYFSAVPALRFRLKRVDEYSMDSLLHNNADKAATEAYEQPEGIFGNCKKSYPTSKIWTPGLFILTCTCSRKTVLAFCIMDCGESPRTFFSMIRNRFRVAPSLIFYDNR
jgi:hypothetical protein